MQITEPTPIQAEAIPALLAGNDLVGQSATGSGKTLAYGIPLVERLTRDKRTVQALVLVPTRELAVQVNAVLSKLAASRRLTTALLVGGRAYSTQMSALRYGSQIVVGTPGRVKDHLDRGSLVLSHLRICVLDEADQMLDSGFAPAVEEILSTTPDTRQMAFFSATMPDWIEKLQKKFLKDPIKVAITPAMGEQSTIEQIAYQVPQEQKMAALCTLLHSTQGGSSLIFGRTKFGVERLGKQLTKLGFAVGTLHGDKSQRAREEVLTAFRRGQVRTLLATNVAARGLDIQGIAQVINYELPESSDLFTHRIGRTGRMGRQGKAITLLVPSDLPKWRRMARNLGQVVTLQKLAIDEEATIATSSARSEVLVMQEYEQKDEQRPGRDRKRFSQDQERGRRAQPRQDSQAASGLQRRQKESFVREMPAWEAEDLPVSERPYSDKARDGRRDAGRPARFDPSMGKRKARSFTATESPRPAARKKPGVPPSIRARRSATSKRATSR
jgi:ATP-dependent RNA helicase DeaD